LRGSEITTNPVEKLQVASVSSATTRALVRSMSSTAVEIASPQAHEDLTRPTSGAAAPQGVIILGGAHGSLAVARSLGRHGVPVWYIGDDHPIARYSRYVSRRLTWNRFAPDDAVAILRNLAEHEGASGWVLFPSGDAETQLVAQHHAALAEHFRLFTMPWETLKRLNDKSLLYKLAAEVGAGFPRSYDHQAGERPLPEAFPVIIKPVSTERPNALTRDKAWRVDTPADLDRRLPEAVMLMGSGQVVVQEMIPGDGAAQFSYAGLWEDGQERAFLTARRTRQFPVDFGMTSSFVETLPVPQVADAARRILGAVRFDGLVEMEFKFDSRDQTYKVLDANTRTWAWIGIGASAGVDFPYLTWCLATGRELPEQLATRPASWLYPARNILSLVQQWRRGNRPPLSAWLSMLGASTWATFAWDDPVPGIVEFPIQIGRFWRRRRLRRASRQDAGH